MPVSSELLLATTLMVGLLFAPSSFAAKHFTTRCDQAPGSLGDLSGAQKKTFLKSEDELAAGRYGDAYGDLRGLLAQVPQDAPEHAVMAELTAEAAIFAGERSYAISLLKPVEERDGSDCLARTLLARADAESGESAERDAEINALIELHKQSPKSSVGKLDAFLLEQHKLEDGGMVRIWYGLQPWGPHNTHLYSEILDASGQTIARLELDSDDPDQVYFRQIHPELAARGDRRYSLDAFADRTSPDGKVDREHALIQFFDGAPSYDTVRDRILTIAERSAKMRRDQTSPRASARAK